MGKRADLRSLYMQGWYEMDAEKLLASTAEDFFFDDPVEPGPVKKDGLRDYMMRWEQRTRSAGATNQWKLSHEVRQDRAGVLTDWEWWELIGTNLSGSAVIQTSDRGVLLERITYFDRSALPFRTNR